MSLILNIDTSLSIASIAISKDGGLVAWDRHNARDENGWLHERIPGVLKESGFTISQLSAVATSIGPGSYTGLRIGLAAAKGLCFALDIPLIAINTLKMIATAVQDECEEDGLICPMIDARRMEVFTAMYDNQLNEISAAEAIIIDDQFVSARLSDKKIVICGNAGDKIKPLIQSPSIHISDKQADARHLSLLSCQEFVKKQFADLAYTEPLYIKEFFSGSGTGL